MCAYVQIMQMYSTASSTLRDLLSHPSLQMENVDKTLSEMSDALAEQAEINSAIEAGAEDARRAAMRYDDEEVDEKELEDELERLVSERKKEEEEQREREERETKLREEKEEEERRRREKEERERLAKEKEEEARKREAAKKQEEENRRREAEAEKASHREAKPERVAAD
jgi:charged multivesicular body protein 7